VPDSEGIKVEGGGGEMGGDFLCVLLSDDIVIASIAFLTYNSRSSSRFK
jgi:hypothetical protein